MDGQFAEGDASDVFARFAQLSGEEEVLTESSEGLQMLPSHMDVDYAVEDAPRGRGRELEGEQEGYSDEGEDNTMEYDSGDDELEDEYDPPTWSYEDYENSQNLVYDALNRWSQWLYDHIEAAKMAHSAGETHRTPAARLTRLIDKWQDFLMRNDVVSYDLATLQTYDDRSVRVTIGSSAYANIMQAVYLRKIPRMIECAKEIMDRYKVTQDANLLDFDIENDEEDLEGGGNGWADPRNNQTRYNRANELRTERTSMREFRIRVVHLGVTYSPWITTMTKLAYQEDQKMRCMPQAKYLAHMRRSEPPASKTYKKKTDEQFGMYVPKEGIRLPYWKRVASYTQSEVMRAVKLITRDLSNLRHTQELEDFFYALMFRNSTFFAETSSEEVLDCLEHRISYPVEKGQPPMYSINRRHVHWTFYYFYPLYNRFIYRDLYAAAGNRFIPHFPRDPKYDKKDAQWLLKKGVKRHSERFMRNRYRHDDVIGITDEEVDATRTWVRRTVFYALDKGMPDLCTKSAEDSYSFPGDRPFYNYLHPKNPDNTSAVLQSIRPEDQEIGNELQAENRVTIETIMGGIGFNPISDAVMLDAIGMFFETEIHDEMNWRHTIVIDASDINLATWTLMNSPHPLLLQIFSEYEVIYDGKAYRAKSTLHAVALWFKMMDRWHQGIMTGGVDINAVLNGIWRPKDRYEDLSDALHARPLPED